MKQKRKQSMARDRVYRLVIAVMKVLTRTVSQTSIKEAPGTPSRDSFGIIVLNHISLLDPLVVGGSLGARVRIHALAKDSLFSTPVIGYFMKKMDHIPVYRNSDRAVDALHDAIRGVRDGKTVALYPEGTIPKDEPLRFKTGGARIAIEAGAPVTPIGQWGIQEAFPAKRGHRLRHLLKAIFKKPRHVLVIGESLVPSPGESVEGLTRRIQESVEALTAQARELVLQGHKKALL